jgi:hypothetical protein
MPGIEITGFEELRRNTDHVCKDVLDRAIRAAEDAAAEVIKKAVEASAPRLTGQLASNIIVYESVDRKALAGSGRKRLLVGPRRTSPVERIIFELGSRDNLAPAVALRSALVGERCPARSSAASPSLLFLVGISLVQFSVEAASMSAMPSGVGSSRENRSSPCVSRSSSVGSGASSRVAIRLRCAKIRNQLQDSSVE